MRPKYETLTRFYMTLNCPIDSKNLTDCSIRKFNKKELEILKWSSTEIICSNHLSNFGKNTHLLFFSPKLKFIKKKNQ